MNAQVRSVGARLHGVRGLAAPIAAITVFGMAMSMSYPLLSLLLERMEVSGAAIGFSSMAAAVMTVVAAPLLPRILARTGLAPLLIAAAATLGVIMLLYPLIPDYWAWIALRLVYGFAATCLFFGSEYWIVAASPPGRRGRIVAIYTVSLSVTWMTGPLIVGAVGIEGFLPFAIGSAILFAGVIPLFWGGDAAPRADPETPPSLAAPFRFFVSDPAVIWGVVCFGFVEYGAVALLAVWGVRTGFTEAESAIVLASFAAGSVLFQFPVGWAADRFDRRWLLAFTAALTVLPPILLTLASGNLVAVIACVMLWGGMAVGLYSLALTELGSRYTGSTLSEGNAAVVLAYGIGALTGPPILGFAMDLIPPDGILWFAAGGAAIYLCLVLYRIRVSARPALPPGAGRAP